MRMFAGIELQIQQNVSRPANTKIQCCFVLIYDQMINIFIYFTPTPARPMNEWIENPNDTTQLQKGHQTAGE